MSFLQVSLCISPKICRRFGEEAMHQDIQDARPIKRCEQGGLWAVLMANNGGEQWVWLVANKSLSRVCGGIERARLRLG
ncbi:hypothetical protein TIFTF001_004360 [Ficus carica]|uniref:Uncharacterized protein n=1 Tax=Ficus carica TaxID=3494 RepID=A0AA87ZFT7_FICCA|nr:hypothetical protein TIFTF001_004360 [Ficus carica]